LDGRGDSRLSKAVKLRAEALFHMGQFEHSLVFFYRQALNRSDTMHDLPDPKLIGQGSLLIFFLSSTKVSDGKKIEDQSVGMQ
jgi:hypothetical protein